MSIPPDRRRLFLVAACLLPVVGGCFGNGCLRGEVVKFARYDPAADSFAFLEVYANINSWKGIHYDRVADLWARRGNLVVNPVPRVVLFGGATVLERLGPHRYREVDLGERPAQESPAVETAVDLDTIRVIPGEFFRNEHGGLTYAQGAVIPGPTVDACLRELVPQLGRWLGEAAREAGDHARDPAARPLTWDDLRAGLVVELDKKAKPAEPGPRSGPLDAESLRRWAEATPTSRSASTAGGPPSTWSSPSRPATPPKSSPPSTSSDARSTAACWPARRSIPPSSRCWPPSTCVPSPAPPPASP